LSNSRGCQIEALDFTPPLFLSWSLSKRSQIHVLSRPWLLPVTIARRSKLGPVRAPGVFQSCTYNTDLTTTVDLGLESEEFMEELIQGRVFDSSGCAEVGWARG
jgi:hypothetical protein